MTPLLVLRSGIVPDPGPEHGSRRHQSLVVHKGHSYRGRIVTQPWYREDRGRRLILVPSGIAHDAPLVGVPVLAYIRDQRPGHLPVRVAELQLGDGRVQRDLVGRAGQRAGDPDP